jgi:hypothetical protein
MPCHARIIRGPARRDNELGNKINEKMKKKSFEDVDYKFDEPSQGLGGGVNNLIKINVCSYSKFPDPEIH